MVVERETSGPYGVVSLVKAIAKGRKLDDDVREAIERLFGTPVSYEGFSRLFQPGFPGIRVFAVEARVAPDHAVEITLVAVARDGGPVWWGSRAFVHGRSGAIEIHLGDEEIEQSHRSRNITVDLVQRSLDVIALVSNNASSRITIDAHGIGSYISALHGFIFADETEDGPPVRSERALEPEGDRRAWLEHAPQVIEKIAERQNIARPVIDAAIAALAQVKTPWDIARLTFDGALAEGDDGELGVGALGRELLLSREMPPWRAALYIDHHQHRDAKHRGEEYRKRKSSRSEMRLATELQEARELLQSPKREAKSRALKTLGIIAPAWIAPEIKTVADSDDRRLMVQAKQTLRQLNGAELGDRLLHFAETSKAEIKLRGLAYRVLAEHFKAKLVDKVSFLRVNPDARIQRAIVPLLEDDPTDAGPNLASLLAANPAIEGEHNRPGLTRLRLELIERLTKLVDPRTLPALLGSFRARPPPPPAEMLALSRALVAFPDPRAHLALTEVARRLDRPAIP